MQSLCSARRVIIRAKLSLPGIGRQVIFAIILATALQPAWAKNFLVDVGGASLTFAPASLTLTAGDSVTFINKGGAHNVVADDNSFRCAHGCDNDGNHGSGNVSNSNWLATVTLNTPGTLGYFCEQHGDTTSGMRGELIVQAAQARDADPVPTISLALLALLTGTIVVAGAYWNRQRRR